MPDILHDLMSLELIWVLIPITAIIAVAIVRTVKAVHRHQERIAMIRQGMHPDALEQETEDDSAALGAQSPADLRQTTDFAARKRN